MFPRSGFTKLAEVKVKSKLEGRAAAGDSRGGMIFAMRRQQLTGLRVGICFHLGRDSDTSVRLVPAAIRGRRSLGDDGGLSELDVLLADLPRCIALGEAVNESAARHGGVLAVVR